jgi:hypothetical protein
MDPINIELIRLLTAIGNVGLNLGEFKLAEAVFDGLAAVRTESDVPWIGKALIKMSQGWAEEACRILESEALTRKPESLEAKVFLGLALKDSNKRGAGFKLLSELANRTDDAPASRLAKSLLETY